MSCTNCFQRAVLGRSIAQTKPSERVYFWQCLRFLRKKAKPNPTISTSTKATDQSNEGRYKGVKSDYAEKPYSSGHPKVPGSLRTSKDASVPNIQNSSSSTPSLIDDEKRIKTIPKQTVFLDLNAADIPTATSDERPNEQGRTPDLESRNGLALSIYRACRATRESMRKRCTEEHPIQDCVFGGEEGIYKVWAHYGIRPHALFAASDIHLPRWCRENSQPTYVIRSPLPLINRMLHAKLNDSFAAHFPAPKRMRKDVLFSREVISSPGRILALHGMQIPSNLGALLKYAVTIGFHTVILMDCVSLLNEKVLRAAEGAHYHPHAVFVEIPSQDPRKAAELLEDVAIAQRLVPCVTLPAAETTPITEFARSLYWYNQQRRQPFESPQPLENYGALVVLGGEHHGLRAMCSHWKRIRPQYVSVTMDHCLVESLNVVSAGAILMHALRHSADKDHERDLAHGISFGEDKLVKSSFVLPER